MRALGIVDFLFLLLEDAKQPMNVAGVCVFELPCDHTDDFLDQLIGQLSLKNLPNFPFNQQLYHGLAWQEVEKFDIRQHCHRHRLQTGTMAEALDRISQLHRHRLMRDQPLWQMHWFENLEPASLGKPKRFVLYLKIHHAVLDGVAAMRLFQRSLSPLPDERLPTPLWLRNIRQQKSSFYLEKKSVFGLIKEQASSIAPVLRELIADYHISKRQKTHQQTSDELDNAFISSLQAPPSILNQRIGENRKLVVTTLEKPRFVKVAKQLNVSTNDVILAVCSYAIRAYLLSQNALPDRPLIAFVPASLRKNDTAIGNQVSFIPANLGTNHTDLMARLMQIHISTRAGKARIGRMNQVEFINYTVAHYAWAGINLATRFFPKKQAFNLIISNVPGDDESLYLNGAKLSAMYPMSVLFDGQALNISLANYQDSIDFGLTACQSTLPNIESLTQFLADGLVAYEQLCSQSCV